MCPRVSFCQLLPRVTYRTMITSWGAKTYHGLTTKTTWRLPSTRYFRGSHLSTTCRTKPTNRVAYNITQEVAPPLVRQTAYEVLVRPTLEYATCAWASYTKTGIQIMEGVQQSAARFVTGDYRSRSSVGAVCTNLMWNSLYTRRRLRYATMFFNIHHDQMRISLTVVITTADARTIHQHKHNPRTLSAT